MKNVITKKDTNRYFLIISPTTINQWLTGRAHALVRFTQYRHTNVCRFVANRQSLRCRTLGTTFRYYRWVCETHRLLYFWCSRYADTSNSWGCKRGLSQVNPVCTIPLCFFKIRFSIFLPPTFWSYNWSLLFTASDETVPCIYNLIRVTEPAHLNLLDFVALIFD
jgi:hypothetical protein